MERQNERLAQLRKSLTNQVSIDPAVAAAVLVHLAPYMSDALPAYWVTEPTTATADSTTETATLRMRNQPKYH